MILTCYKSGIPFSCDHFPATIKPYHESHLKIQHPVFSIPQKSLLQYIHKWSNGGFTHTDLYLYYLSLLDSTELVDWRTNATVSQHTLSTIAQNIIPLVHIIGKMNTITHPSFKPHRISINQETSNLHNSPHWIANWNKSVEDFGQNYRDEIQHDRMMSRERAIQRMIADKSKPISYYAKSLATWADMAAEFPTHLVRINGNPIALNEYWKDIIIRCTNDDRIFQIPEAHIEKLLEHCEESLDVIESSLGYTLLRLIRDGLHRQKTYLGFDDIDGFTDSNPGFKIISEQTSQEQALIMALVEAAPKEKPIKENFQNLVSYLKAKQKYDQAQEYIKQQALIRVLEDNMSEKIQEEISDESMQEALEDALNLNPEVESDDELDGITLPDSASDSGTDDSDPDELNFGDNNE